MCRVLLLLRLIRCLCHTPTVRLGCISDISASTNPGIAHTSPAGHSCASPTTPTGGCPTQRPSKQTSRTPTHKSQPSWSLAAKAPSSLPQFLPGTVQRPIEYRTRHPVHQVSCIGAPCLEADERRPGTSVLSDEVSAGTNRLACHSTVRRRRRSVSLLGHARATRKIRQGIRRPRICRRGFATEGPFAVCSPDTTTRAPCRAGPIPVSTAASGSRGTSTAARPTKGHPSLGLGGTRLAHLGQPVS